jgi:hypothetical protein
VEAAGLRAGGGGGTTGADILKFHGTASGSIPNGGTGTALTITAVYDPEGWGATATRITLPRSGMFRVELDVKWGGGGVVARRVDVLRVNSGGVLQENVIINLAIGAPSPFPVAYRSDVARCSASAGDWFSVGGDSDVAYLYQNSGGAQVVGVSIAVYETTP